MTATLMPAVLLIAAVASATAQSPAAPPPTATPTFAVASIKPSAPSTGGAALFGVGQPPGGQWISQNATMQMILRAAYPGFPLPGQIVGGPAWFDTARFDINAKAEGNPPRDVMTEMLKQLLADRFKLKVHTESRELDLYALALARTDGRLGPGLRRTAIDCQAIAEGRRKAVANGAPLQIPTMPKPGKRPECGMMVNAGGGVQKLLAGGSAISVISSVIQSVVGRPVVDRTGLTGSFDIDLEYGGSSQLTTAADQATAPASVFTAVQEQLGLKLESRKEKMDVLVIDQIEMPTPN